MTTAYNPPPLVPIVPQAKPKPQQVTFDAEARVRHAATLWIVIGYLWLIGSALGFLLILASFSSTT